MTWGAIVTIGDYVDKGPDSRRDRPVRPLYSSGPAERFYRSKERRPDASRSGNEQLLAFTPKRGIAVAQKLFEHARIRGGEVAVTLDLHMVLWAHR